jgi:hypothetical protein
MPPGKAWEKYRHVWKKFGKIWRKAWKSMEKQYRNTSEHGKVWENMEVTKLPHRKICGSYPIKNLWYG